ncbi:MULTISPECIES: class I SAM-dependent methyltransferase [Auritidibacter]|uniref:Class I SAM-dependent methyltransferase n=1 Tax=Auritidibacter ignavus TaxID=678932 RepID=A0AAJ6DCT9_9MICC|nr:MULTISPECIES: class I SAM-dependent methyltransferase [Auritidibacter]PXA79003.1 hypothetical protein DCC26_06315 [Auritidibacter sp. NML120779]AXR73958.1 class I SAM-dependent methyltransferase [Auritidibacter sp. NML130574]WGH84470.1 class I SAM-dependent methyltransferase [Auritidibacter ignavus]WGH93794.1 class I SAM-dependent methyltransferase [Auritidibacter ignavus]WHS27389.1 class I SAM-dependent methyltransferase [Auritidibacter ignavus]
MQSRIDAQARARRWWHSYELARIAHDYDDRQTKMVSVVAAQTAIRLVGGSEEVSVLDIGCGRGELLAQLARKQPGWALVGIDPDPTVQEGRLEGNFELISGSAADAPAVAGRLPFPGLVVSTLSMALWDDPERLLPASIAAAPAGTGALVIDLLRPPNTRSREAWASFASGDDERRFMMEQSAAWLDAGDWVRLVGQLRATLPASTVEVACEDIRFLGMTPTQWDSAVEEVLSRAEAAGGTTGVLLRVLSSN